ncbi:MAG: aspartate carbamoyltransferase regulatory subunit [Promethearchaeota archaeon]
MSNSPEEKKELLIRAIGNGTVIDHISAGQGILVLQILGIAELTHIDDVVSLVMNVDSRSRNGKKDIVKVSNKFLNKEEVDKISLIAPYATINEIKDWKVARKYRVSLPDKIERILKCPNPKCVTNYKEPVFTEFLVENKDPIILRCLYCERLIDWSPNMLFPEEA